MNSETEGKLNNEYVRGYYNKVVGGISEGYTDYRWFSTAAGKFDYRQTKRALDKALGSDEYQTALEIGPGDAVWTEIIKKHVTGNMHLVEQSDEMISQAKAKLEGKGGITFEHSDFLKSEAKNNIDLVVSLRCFEYFDDKPASVEKIFNSLAPGGKFILVTKNSQYVTTKGVQDRTVHSDQKSRSEMIDLLESAGFTVNHVFPAMMRWKIKYALMRLIFDSLHKLSVATNGLFRVPFLESRSTESYTYIATKDSA